MQSNPILVAICLALAIVVVALSTTPPIHNQNPPMVDRSAPEKAQTKSDNRSQRSIVSIDCDPNCAAEAFDDNRYPGYAVWLLNKSLNDPIAGFTGLLFIATLLLAFVAWVQIRDSRVFQRAYVSVEPQGIHGMNPSELLAHISIANAGNLPARGVKWKIKSLFDESGELDDSCFSTHENELEGNNVLPPKGKMIQGSETISEPKMLLAQDDIRRFHGKKRHFLYVYGLVIYRDGFEKIRHTRFCHRYNCAIFDQRKRSIEAEGARHHREGNDAT